MGRREDRAHRVGCLCSAGAECWEGHAPVGPAVPTEQWMKTVVRVGFVMEQRGRKGGEGVNTIS